MPIAAEAWAHWYRRILPAYWLFLAFMTHLPRPEIPGQILYKDKWLHVAAFGVLALLVWRFGETFVARVSAGYVRSCALLLLAYACVDEWTQPLFGRSASWWDLAADCVGIAIALGWLEVQRVRRAAGSGAAGEGVVESRGRAS